MKLYKYWVIRVMPKDGGLSCRTQWCLMNGNLQKYVFQIFWVNFDMIFDAPKIIQTIFHIKDIIWCFPINFVRSFIHGWYIGTLLSTPWRVLASQTITPSFISRCNILNAPSYCVYKLYHATQSNNPIGPIRNMGSEFSIPLDNYI